MKECSKCHIDKPESEFYKSSANKDGLSYACKKCKREYNRNRYSPKGKKEGICSVCGTEFKGRVDKKYCSKKCKWKARYERNGYTKHAITCINCGKNAEVAQEDGMYCSTECFYEHTDYSHFKKVYDYDVECVTCGDSFVAKSNRTKYCSDECNPSNWERTCIYFKYCTLCGDYFVAKRSNEHYCCDQCAKEAGAINDIKNKMDSGHYIDDCACCGDTFTTLLSGHRNYCSDECCDEYNRQVKRSYESHRARARKRGVYYERVHRLEVFERDNYICQECGIKTDAELVGKNTNKDNEPTLDHVVPISLGGPHSYSNVQCLCRKCNVIKSNNYEGQLKIL